MNVNETPLRQPPKVPDERLQYARRVMARHGRPKPVRPKVLIQQIQNDLAKPGTSSQETDLLHLTLEFLGEWQPPPSPPFWIANDVAAAKVAAIAVNLQRCIAHLERLAGDGQREAVELLARHTLRVSDELSRLRKKNAKLLKPVARESIFWPVLKSRCQHFDDTGKALDQAHAVILRDLEVGCDHPIQGYKIKLSDELGKLTLELLQEVWSYKTNIHIFQAVLQVPTGWRLDAMKLRSLTRNEKAVDRWAKVLELMLREKFPSDAAMAEKYKDLVSQNKRVGTGTILTELRHLIRGRLRGIAGLGRKSKGMTPQMAWLHGRHATIQKEKNQSFS